MAGAQEYLAAALFLEPCAFNDVLTAAQNLDENIRYGNLDEYREVGIETLLQTDPKDDLSWADASDDFGWAWGPLVDPSLCADFQKGYPKFLLAETLKKREDSWIWEGDQDGIFYSSVKGFMERYFGQEQFVAIEIVPGGLVSAFKINLESGTGTDAWVGILAGPWWGGCSAMLEAREDLGVSEIQELPNGCLLL